MSMYKFNMSGHSAEELINWCMEIETDRPKFTELELLYRVKIQRWMKTHFLFLCMN